MNDRITWNHTYAFVSLQKHKNYSNEKSNFDWNQSMQHKNMYTIICIMYQENDKT